MSQEVSSAPVASSTSLAYDRHEEQKLEPISRVQEARAKFGGKSKDAEVSRPPVQPVLVSRSSVNDMLKGFESKFSGEPDELKEPREAVKSVGAPKKQNNWRRLSSRLLTPHTRKASEDTPNGIVDLTGSGSGPKNRNEDHVVSIQCLVSRDLGKFHLNPTTTFNELRSAIANKLGHSNFTFQDRETKRQWTNEDIPILSIKAPILVSQSGLDNLLADSTFHDKSNISVLPDGTTAFKLFWWDSLNHTRRSVWLKFEPQRISVTSAGGSFKLFDANGMRSNLRFASVRGSDKGFQFVKGKMASRFFATSVEQKNTLSIFFCFVWRPNAVRRGWLPPLEDPLSNEAVDATDPRMFSSLLRRHLVEVDQIVKNIEKSMDPRVVRSYIKMFIQMFSGGYSIQNSEGGILDRALGDKQLSAMGALRDNLGLNQEVLGDPGSSAPLDGKRNRVGPTGKDHGELFEMTGSVEANSPSTMQSGTTDPNAPPAPPGGIPPPPCPPGGPLIQKPPICPVNFEGISAHDIPGTIWADLTSFTLSSDKQAQLTKDLTLIFGRESRERSLMQDDGDEAVGVLEAGRLRNLEVLLNMEELKGLTYSQIVDMILAFDGTLFDSYSVLERLARRSTKEGGVQYAFLPTQKESEALLVFAEQNGDESLRPGEVFFLELAIRVPDRIQRFEYGTFLTKFTLELPGVEHELLLLEAADGAVRGSERFKRALKIILDILTTLMPRFGLTRGFRISSFLPSTERVNGTVANPSEGRVSAEEEMAAIEASVPTSLPEKERRKQIKLAMMRKKVQTTKDKDFWSVRLQEFIACYTNRFEACEGFWDDLIDVCDTAMRVDQVALDQQTGEWLLQYEEVKEYYDHMKAQGDSNPFLQRLAEFIRVSGPTVTKIRAAVLEARKKTDALWKWMGEVMGGDPSLIFKHIHDFSHAFEQHWKALTGSWDHRKTMVLRGALTLEKYVPPPKEEVEAKKRKNMAPSGGDNAVESERSATLRAAAAATLRKARENNDKMGANLQPHNASADPDVHVRPKKVSAVSAIAAALGERRELDVDELLAGSASSEKLTDPPGDVQVNSHHALDTHATDGSGDRHSSDRLSHPENEPQNPKPSETTDETSSSAPGALSSSEITNSYDASPQAFPEPRRKTKPSSRDDSSSTSSRKNKRSGKSSPSSTKSNLEVIDVESDEEMLPIPTRPRSTSHGDAHPHMVHPAKYPVPGRETADDSSPVIARKKPKSKLKKMIKLRF